MARCEAIKFKISISTKRSVFRFIKFVYIKIELNISTNHRKIFLQKFTKIKANSWKTSETNFIDCTIS